jgi:hypothetical protein
VTVRLGIFNATCRTAEFALPLTDASRVAALDATALASLATCVDVAVTALDDTLTTSVTELRTKYEAHRVHSSHAASDTVNVMGREAPYVQRTSRETLNEIHDRLLAHMTTGTWHSYDDTKNLPLCGKAGDDGSAVVLCAELRFRVYELHRAQVASPASHSGGGDGTALTTAKPLAATIRDYLTAVLLGRPHDMSNGTRRAETVNDADGFLANFWRALAHDPEAVAHWCDWPVNEVDLFARHLWLVNTGRSRLLEGMEADPDFYDAQVAGWWVWGVNAWIGSGWCSGDGPWVDTGDGIGQRPHLGDAGQGVNRQLPHLGDAGQGVNRKRPHLGTAGQGVNRQLPHLGDAGRFSVLRC